ncbi:MAG TPA: VWA domain-containing protein [Acidimicrobiales bacterium]|nr:VWA domain-containing protein [Acidimicrobiales bacterium]
MTTFSVEVHQNEYLPIGGTDVSAVVRVTSDGSVGASGVEASEVIILDVSGSMQTPRTKIRAAVAATIAAIQCVRDGAHFAVIAGSTSAREVFPGDGHLAVASEETRTAAITAVAQLTAGGGTVMASWLWHADALFASRPGAINHAILLTDGKDGAPEELQHAVAECEGRFQCDCRGIGADWDVAQLRQVASALLGDLGLVREPDELTADFTGLMERAMARAVNDVALRVWTPQSASVVLLKQVAPVLEDLTGRRTDSSDRTGDYPTGAWAAEYRDYHLRIHVPARDSGEEMLAARVTIVVDDVPVAEGKVRAVWTTDDALSTRLNAEVVRCTGHTDYADAVQRGVEALRAGDEGTATTNLGRAAQLAQALGDDAKLAEVSRVVHIDDAERGTVRLKRHVDELDVMELDTNSTRTVRVRSSTP